MRWVIGALTAFWAGLTVLAYVVVLPDERQSDALLMAVSEAIAVARNEPVHEGLAELAAAWPDDLEALTARELNRLPTSRRNEYLARVDRWWSDLGIRPASRSVARLVWSTDDNPARRVQTHLFRVWHLREYGSPIDIVTDPSNRDITKTIVQCIAGAGPDIIEAYGPIELGQFVKAGVALDVTDRAISAGFGVDRVFESARSSVEVDGRQYAFTCNVGYTVLFYHRDLFERAGVTPPSEYRGGWSIDQLIETASAMQEDAARRGERVVGIMGLTEWPMVYGAGSRFFDEDGALCTFDNERTISALTAYQDLIYRHRVMPTPGQAASMASAGGANMHADVASASASSLFAAKATSMVTDGRWTYATLASRNRDRVIRPAMERRIRTLERDGGQSSDDLRETLERALSSLIADVLVPLSDEEFEAMEESLTDDDRKRLIHVGIAHVPTLIGTPWYETAGRVAIVNRASPNAELATRFLRFLASEGYNEQINGTFDSISGMPDFCNDENGIGGPPRALPGLEDFDSPVFSEAIERWGHPWEVSPFIGRTRQGILIQPVFEDLTNDRIGPAEAAGLIEQRLNRQIHANLRRDHALRTRWEGTTGRRFDPGRSLKDQLEGGQ